MESTAEQARSKWKDWHRRFSEAASKLEESVLKIDSLSVRWEFREKIAYLPDILLGKKVFDMALDLPALKNMALSVQNANEPALIKGYGGIGWEERAAETRVTAFKTIDYLNSQNPKELPFALRKKLIDLVLGMVYLGHEREADERMRKKARKERTTAGQLQAQEEKIERYMKAQRVNAGTNSEEREGAYSALNKISGIMQGNARDAQGAIIWKVKDRIEEANKQLNKLESAVSAAYQSGSIGFDEAKYLFENAKKTMDIAVTNNKYLKGRYENKFDIYSPVRKAEEIMANQYAWKPAIRVPPRVSYRELIANKVAEVIQNTSKYNVRDLPGLLFSSMRKSRLAKIGLGIGAAALILLTSCHGNSGKKVAPTPQPHDKNYIAASTLVHYQAER